ncbi:MAG TPA: fluoride efflux transporter CrcB [Flavobacteriales bacterium]|jgi:CrcB protein|nr:fluoride efflux transporter CrcB [Flavobacteriales bacterium]
MNALAVFIGGGLGSLARYGVGWGVTLVGWTTPIGTLISNVLATALLLLILGQAANTTETLSPKHQAMFALLTIGFCGAFSTFSTFAADTIQLFQSQGWAWATANILSNLILCMAAGYWAWTLAASTS